MKEAQFILTVEEANIILHALGNLPYVQSFPIIEKLRKQWQEQLPKENNVAAAQPA